MKRLLICTALLCVSGLITAPANAADRGFALLDNVPIADTPQLVNSSADTAASLALRASARVGASIARSKPVPIAARRRSTSSGVAPERPSTGASPQAVARRAGANAAIPAEVGRMVEGARTT